MFDAATLDPQGEVPVGPHPNAMVFSKDGSRLFVACANTNAVWVIDLASKTAREQISVALYPNAPPGTTPNGLGLSPDGATLLVANADNNTVAVVDVSKPGASEVEGFIPAGWYPTAAAFDGDGKRIFILSGKGLTSTPNPRANQPMATGADGQYIGAMLQGSLSILDTPDEARLKELTKKVYALTPYTDARKLAPPEAPKASPIPMKVGQASPIKYVFYVIRENRTYDQVFGDMERGNGDPNLALLGETITPNAHAIAREFVLLDNFYVDAEVSYDGHAWSMGAYATDVVEKIWPTNYGNRGGLYLSEGGWEDRTPFGNIAAPADGYLWDFATRAGVSVRSYGEFVSRDRAAGVMKATVPGPAGAHPSEVPAVRPGHSRPDAGRYLARRVQAVRIRRQPAAAVDHPAPERPHVGHSARHADAARDGGRQRPGARSHRRSHLAQPLLEGMRDLRARRRRPERAGSRGRAPLAGARHQPVCEAAGARQHALHDVGDAADDGTDSRAAADEPVRRGGNADVQRVPADPRADAVRVPAGPRAARRAERCLVAGSEASLRMNFTEVDMTPEIELNEIIWQSIRGAGSRMPPPVRSAFVRSVEREERDERE